MKKTELVKFVAAGRYMSNTKKSKRKIFPGIFPNLTIETAERYLGHSNVSAVYHERNPHSVILLPLLFFLSGKTSTLVKKNCNSNCKKHHMSDRS